MLSSAHNLWSFACEIYEQSTVSSACLQLQDQHEINVPLLLFCCWSGWRYGELSQEQLQQAMAFSHDCSSIVTEPLRAIRQQMKVHRPSMGNITNSSMLSLPETSWMQLREQVKSLELTSEKLMLEGLNYLVDQQMVIEGNASHAMANIKHCFQPIEKAAAILFITLLSEVFEIPVDDLTLSL